MSSAVKKMMALFDRIFRKICGILPQCLQRLIRRFHRLLTYGFFGFINTSMDYIVYILLYYALNVPVAWSQAVGLLTGSSTGYILNSNITFAEGKGRTRGQYFQYVGLEFFLAAFTGLFMKWMEPRIRFSMLLLKLFVTLGIAMIHYFVYKLFVFRIREDETDHDR